MLSASFYHRSRVSARLVTRGSRDTVANVMALELNFQKKYYLLMAVKAILADLAAV